MCTSNGAHDFTWRYLPNFLFCHRSINFQFRCFYYMQADQAVYRYIHWVLKFTTRIKLWTTCVCVYIYMLKFFCMQHFVFGSIQCACLKSKLSIMIVISVFIFVFIGYQLNLTQQCLSFQTSWSRLKMNSICETSVFKVYKYWNCEPCINMKIFLMQHLCLGVLVLKYQFLFHFPKFSYINGLIWNLSVPLGEC